MPPCHPAHHRTQRIGWLRAAMLGANDGIVSTASLILGVAARVGGAPLAMGALRVAFWGALAMLVTARGGSLFGTVA